MKTILIAGGGGFIGNNLCRKLLEENKVICIDSFYTSNKKNILPLLKNPNFKLIEEDINNPILIKEDIDEIYNLACPASPIAYQTIPLTTIKTSINGLINILNLSMEKDSKLIHLSTSEIYGNPLENPQSEGYNGNVNTTNPRSCYDESKRLSETIVYEYTKKYGLNTATLRVFNTYGEFMLKNDGRVVSNFINQAINNKPLTIYGNGNQTRSLMYISDLIEGLLLVMKNIKKFKSPTNIGNPYEITINELANLILYLTNSNSTKIYLKLPSNDPIKRNPNIELIQSLINWKPKIELKEGLIKTIEYYQKINGENIKC